ncbi:MAG: transporter [Alphaproteobacteria bacterium]|nr:transporter [Alphaproteobacteria bacterium]
MKRIWIALGLALLAPCGASAEVARQSLDDAWWTGPLLAPTAGTLPVGHFLFEPYFYDAIPTAAVDAAGHSHPVARANNFGSQSYFLYGLADRFTVGLIPRFGFKDADDGLGSASVNAGDLTLQAQYQLTRFEEGGFLPTISVNLGETLPTGAYDRLDRFADGFGAGAYTTTLSLYSQTYFWMPNGRILRTRLNLSYALSDTVDLMDRSVYGTMPGFRGHASPGGSAVADLAFEYSIDRNWVAAMDFWLEQDENTRVTGNYPGAPRMVSDLGRARIFYVAPALEYNFSGSFGVILGARIFAAGENQTATVTPVIAFNYVH